MLTRLLAAAALLSILVGLAPQTVAAQTPLLRRWMFMNKYDADVIRTLKAHITELDVVAPVYYTVKANGEITGSDRDDVRSVLRGTAVRYIPVVRNEPRYEALSPLLNDVTTRRNLVERLAQLAIMNGYDGLNIDFEGVDATDRKGLTAFTALLTDRLRTAGKLSTLSVAAKPRELTTGWAGAYDYAALGSASDYIVVMTYAYHEANDKPGSTAPISWLKRTIEFAVSQIGANKVLLGVGLWGYDWNVTSGGVAAGKTYAQTEEIMKRPGAVQGYSAEDESAWVKYWDNGDEHIIWYEDARAIKTKLQVAVDSKIAGFAAWRLGQEGPFAWTAFSGYSASMGLSGASGGGATGGTKTINGTPGISLPETPATPSTAPAVAAKDWAIPNGRFYTQTGDPLPGGGRSGFPVTDDDGVLFYREMVRNGGVEGVGYPISSRFLWNGFTTQVFQKAIFQWSPEAGEVNFVNVFDELTRAGKDNWLLQQRSTPKPLGADFDGNRNWDQILIARMALLEKDPAIKATYLAKSDPLRYYGLPTSPVIDMGNHNVMRLQRVVIQHWKQDVPWAKAGTITIANGGEIAVEAGLIPAGVTVPKAP